MAAVIDAVGPIFRVNRFRDVARKLKTEPKKDSRYSSLAEFYPFYLTEHSNAISRSLHIAATGGVVALAVAAALTRKPRFLLGMPLVGYGLAWIGHLLFERNQPATFKQPLYSLASDFLMFRDALSGQLPPRVDVTAEI
jgi:hypothetical protein